MSDLPGIGICFDTGHGHLQDAVPTFDHIRATHVHDNHGEKDEHLWPFEGTLDWPALIEKFVLANYAGPFVFEVRGDELSKGQETKNRLQDLWDEAENSIEEYRLKYRLHS